MSNTRGVCYIAYGSKALRAAARAIDVLRKFSDLPVSLVCSEQTRLDGIQHIPFEDISFGARRSKVFLDTLTPYDHTLYMDADTRVKSADFLKGFEALEKGWDMAMAFSENQGSKLFAHIDREEIDYTAEKLNNVLPLQLQAGVMWFAKTAATEAFFQAWRNEWVLFKHHDQAALLRALYTTPCKIWLLGLDWNSRRGEIVEHLFGSV